MKKYDYPFTIRPLSKEEGGGYLIGFPDLPGCIADGDTIEEAIANGIDAVDSWIVTAQEFGDFVPAPDVSTKKYSGQWRIRVPKHLHAMLALQAKEEGVSLNMFAATLLAAGVGKKLARFDKT